MHYYIPQMLPEYVEVEPHVFQPYCDATVAGWRNEQRLATQQGKHQRPGVTQMVLLADKLQIADTHATARSAAPRWLRVLVGRVSKP